MIILGINDCPGLRSLIRNLKEILNVGDKGDMGTRAGIRIIEEGSGKKAKERKGGKCPVCGADGGKYKCEKCGWSVEELGPDFSTSLKDPFYTFMHARLSYADMKKRSKNLQELVSSLITNNRRFSELVEAMGNEIQRLRVEAGKKYVYRYEQGGWEEIGRAEGGKLHLKKKGITVDDINKQLREIMRLLEKYKK